IVRHSRRPRSIAAGGNGVDERRIRRSDQGPFARRVGGARARDEFEKCDLGQTNRARNCGSKSATRWRLTMQISASTFVVTGGASGLGAACVRQLVAAGGHVVIADLNQSIGHSLASELGATARFIATDVTKAVDGQAAIDLAVREFGALRG